MTDDRQDPYPNAGRDSGYVDAEGKPVGENLVNVLTEHIARLETKLLTSSSKIRELIREKSDEQADKFELALSQYAALRRDDHQFRHEFRVELGAFKESQDTMLTTLQEVVVSTGKTEADITAIVERMDARDVLNDERYEDAQEFQQQSLEHRERLDAAVAAISDRLDTYIAGSKRDVVAEHGREIEAIKAELKRLKVERGGDGNG